MIDVQHLSKCFSEKQVFQDVSLQFNRNETVFVLGRSGVGKSVLLKHLVGLLRPDSGTILVDDENITDMDETALTRIRKKCGMVFQFPALLDSLTVYENISFGIYAHGLAKEESEVKTRVRKVMDLVRLGDRSFDAHPPELSFGTQKRVAIARTLAIEPEYLLFDEPTTGMDPVTIHSINRLISDLKQTLGLGAIVVSHDLESAFSIGDRIVLLDDGLVVFNGSKEDFRRAEHPLAKAFLKEAEIEC